MFHAHFIGNQNDVARLKSGFADGGCEWRSTDRTTFIQMIMEEYQSIEAAPRPLNYNSVSRIPNG